MVPSKYTLARASRSFNPSIPRRCILGVQLFTNFSVFVVEGLAACGLASPLPAPTAALGNPGPEVT
jgi:hypothetical protein